MDRFRVHYFVAATGTLSDLEAGTDAHFADQGWREAAHGVLAAFLPSCEEAGLVLSANSVRSLMECLVGGDCTPQYMKQIAKDAHGRLYEELEARLVLSLSPYEAALYQSQAPFGPEVVAAFPSAVFDIEESSKCLATGRGTASVFHLMRALEVALQVLYKSLQLTMPTKPAWESMLRPLRSELVKPHRNQRSAQWQKHDAFYCGATERLLAVKDAWRNPTMHVERSYAAEEARDIWTGVRAYMRQLATVLHE
jgi:hypothetical protein